MTPSPSDPQMSFALLAIMSGLCAVIYPFLTSLTWSRSLVKTLAIAPLAVWSHMIGFPVLAAGLALSAIGDLALSRPGDRAFLIGMLGFAAAHLIYAWMFYAGGLVPLGGWQSLALVPVIGVALWLGPVFAAKAGALALPVFVYVGIIGVMGATAVMQPMGAGQVIALIGALLFMASDAILGQEKFLNRHWPGQGLAIWGLYYAAQVALFVGFVWIG